MVSQAKRIQVAELNLGVGGRVQAILQAPTEPREAINFHNIWASASCEPETAAANCQGTWVLLYLEDATTSTPTYTDAFINLETTNMFIIACGVFSASNESPWSSGPIHPMTSRTLPAGGRIIMTCTVTGITADLASTRVMLCAHTTRK